MVGIKRSALSIVCLAAFVIHSATGLAGRHGNGPSHAALPERLNAIVELASEALAAHQKADRATNAPADRIALSAGEAQAYRTRLDAEHNTFKASAAAVAPTLRINAEYHTLLNAISVEASPEEVAAIGKLPAVRRLWLTRPYRATLNRSVPLVHAPAMWQQLGGAPAAGAGMKIAILDSGIDITNPLFADSGFTAPPTFPRGDLSLTNNKVIVAKVFLAASDATPADEFGHGTHVAGIAAGDFNTPSPLGPLAGVAPGAYLGNYRVLDRTGSGRDDFIIRALEEAVEDGFDVINLSFGGKADGGMGVLDFAVENAVAAGAVVVAAAGNDGEDGQSTIASPGIAPSVITVGASTNTRVIGPGTQIVLSGTAPVPLAAIAATSGESDQPSAVLETPIGPLPLQSVGSTSDRGCSRQSFGDLAGAVALIERGGCLFSDKITFAQQAGARAVIVFNQQETTAPDAGENLLFMEVKGTTIPSAFVRRSDGLALRDWLQAQPTAQVSFAPVPVIELTAPADELAAYSSRGPAATGALKPDMVAPGDSIYSGAIRDGFGRSITDLTGFAVANGTSQAAPHVAGAAALVKQMHPSWNPAQIKSALMNSAATFNGDVSGTAIAAGVLDAGAGRLDLARAATISATLAPASLSLGVMTLKKAGVRSTVALEVTNVANGPNRFAISVEPADASVGLNLTPKVREVTLETGQTTTVKIKLRAIGGVAQWRDYTGYVVITDRNGQTLRAPYWIRLAKKG
ncbi:MAG TPA: S8 family serine peptidase [Blastocatellia bacterium]|nr:S8 family serine peptidase [Blastocatellia bacterium]